MTKFDLPAAAVRRLACWHPGYRRQDKPGDRVTQLVIIWRRIPAAEQR